MPGLRDFFIGRDEPEALPEPLPENQIGGPAGFARPDNPVLVAAQNQANIPFDNFVQQNNAPAQWGGMGAVYRLDEAAPVPIQAQFPWEIRSVIYPPTDFKVSLSALDIEKIAMRVVDLIEEREAE